MKVFVLPAKGKKVFLSELGKPVPSTGYYVVKNDEVESHLQDGLLLLGSVKDAKTRKKK